MKIKVIIHEAEEGGFWAEIPALKGCVSQGETYEETLENIKEAAQGWLESQSIVEIKDKHSKIIEVAV